MPTIGRADIDVHYDGKGLPEEARRLGQEAGREAGKEYGDAFSEEARKAYSDDQKDLVDESRKRGAEAGEEGGKRFRRKFGDHLDQLVDKDLDKLGRDMAELFKNPKGLTDYANGLDDVDGAFARIGRTSTEVRGKLKELNENGLLADDTYARLRGTVDKWGEAAEKSARDSIRLRDEMVTLSEKTSDYNKNLDETRKKLSEKITLDADEAIKRIDDLADGFDRAHDEADGFGGALGRTANEVEQRTPSFTNGADAVDRYSESHGRLNDAIAKGNGSAKALGELGDGIENIGNKSDAAGPKLIRGGDAVGGLTKLLNDLQGKVDPKTLDDLGGAIDRFGAHVEANGGRLKGAGPAFEEMTGTIGRLNKSVTPGTLGNLGDEIGTIGNRVEESGGKFSRNHRYFENFFSLLGSFDAPRLGGIGGSLGRLGDGADDMGKKMKAALPDVSNFVRALGRFDPADNLGQAILLIIALLPQLAPLASAAAGGLTLLGGAAFGGLLGVGGLALAFSNLVTGDLKDVPAKTAPIARELRDVGTAASDLRDNFQVSVFKGLMPALDDLKNKTLPGLQPAFDVLGGSLNKVLKKWLADLNSFGFKEKLEEVFSAADPVITGLGETVSKVIEAIGQIFIDISPDVATFIGDVNDALDDFNKFLASPEGKEQVHQWLETSKDLLGKVGELIKTAYDEINKLITPQNIENTGKILQAFVDAAPDIAQFASDINEIVVFLAGIVRAVAGFAKEVGSFFEGLMSAADELVIYLQGFFSGIGKEFEAIGNVLEGVGLQISGFSKIVKGDIVGGLEDLRAGAQLSKEGIEKFGEGFATMNGNVSAYFDTLDRESKSKLGTLGTNLDVAGGKGKEFGGTIKLAAEASGKSLDDLAGTESFEELGREFGVSQRTAHEWEIKFGEAFTNVSSDFVDLATDASENLSDIKTDLGLSGKDFDAFREDVIDATGKSQKGLEGLAGAKSWGDIEKALNSAGDKSKTDFANKIIRSAADGEIAIDKLPPKIQNLVDKYNTIPKEKSTDVKEKGTKEAQTAVERLKQAIDNLKDKTVTVTTAYVEQGSPGGIIRRARGGIMAGGMDITPLAGGRALTNGLTAFADGGILRTARRFGQILAGEAGAEAIVPLVKPLSQVDPSVRELAAFARGRTTGGTGSSIGRQVIVGQGAVQVYSNNTNGGQIASSVLDRLGAAIG